VITKGRLVCGASSEIIGDVMCINGNIDGMVRGNIQATDVLKITKTANIDGNITTKKLIVEEGAMIQAKISMSNNVVINSANQLQKSQNPMTGNAVSNLNS
jgi:cytoskeletal protein CcmA (bactofilin family)